MTLHLTNETYGRTRLTLCGRALYACQSMTPAEERELHDPEAPKPAGLKVCPSCETARTQAKVKR